MAAHMMLRFIIALGCYELLIEVSLAMGFYLLVPYAQVCARDLS